VPKAKLQIIEHPEYTNAHERLRELHAAGKDGLPFDHMKILGPSGAGKSTLLEDYAAKYPPHDKEDRTFTPVLLSRVPPRPTIRKLTTRMLHDMRSPFWNKGDELEQAFQLYTLVRECGTELILLDEGQHLVDRGKRKTHALVADWIKEATDETGIPWAIAGLERTKLLDEANDQFGRRFSSEVTLDRWDPADVGDQAQIEGIVAEQVEQFGIRLSAAVNLPRLALCVGYASDGIFGYIQKMTAEVARVQRKNPNTPADLTTFSHAFLSKIWAEAPDTRNPFIAAINETFTRLNGRKEPFAPREFQ